MWQSSSKGVRAEVLGEEVLHSLCHEGLSLNGGGIVGVWLPRLRVTAVRHPGAYLSAGWLLWRSSPPKKAVNTNFFLASTTGPQSRN
jgi:hypothetical protein